jgi:alpha-tubulin suppressor-like RCC1 family protein
MTMVKIPAPFALCAVVSATVVAAVGCGAEDTQEATHECEPVPVMIGMGPVGRVAALFAGAHNTCAVFEDGSMRCWGDNTNGQIGDDTSVGGRYPRPPKGLPAVRQVGVGSEHVCALTVVGCVWCWGENSYGQLGSSSVGSWTPVRVDSVENVRGISTHGHANLVFTGDNRVLWWGLQNPGKGAAEPRPWFDGAFHSSLDPRAFHSSLDLGTEFACGVRNDRRVECWGDNSYGQLGIGDHVDRDQPGLVVGLTDVTQIAAGIHVACAVRSDKTLWCWGDNKFGPLGDGTTTAQPLPQKVPLADVEEISLESTHVCARTTAGRVWCWGRNSSKQVGNGAMGENITEPWKIESIEDVRSIVAGDGFSCVLRNDHDVWCWGYNKYGELGNGTYENSSTPVQVVWDPPQP